jgi:hypothetical protein
MDGGVVGCGGVRVVAIMYIIQRERGAEEGEEKEDGPPTNI